MKKLVFALLAAVALFIGGALVGSSGRGEEADPTEVYRDTVVVFDTVRYVEPMAQSVKPVGAQTYIVPVGSGDGGLARCSSSALTDSTSAGYVTVSVIGTGDGGLARADSAVVELTVVQRHYADSTYEAWVSGPVDPRLDSIYIYNRSQEVTVVKQYRPPNRWSVGVTAGAGLTLKGVQPFVGIGISYAIWRF